MAYKYESAHCVSGSWALLGGCKQVSCRPVRLAWPFVGRLRLRCRPSDTCRAQKWP